MGSAYDRATPFLQLTPPATSRVAHRTTPLTPRTLTLGRRNWTFLGSDSGGERAAVFYTLIQTCKLNGINPEAYLADLIGRVGDHPAHRIDELLPWNWRRRCDAKLAA